MSVHQDGCALGRRQHAEDAQAQLQRYAEQLVEPP